MIRVPLTHCRVALIKVALIDDEDFELIRQWKWRTVLFNKKRLYVRGSKKIDNKWHNILMHRLIMNAKKGQKIDHRTGNRLDNRRSNLRFCTSSQNNMNMKKNKGVSRYKGVCWAKQTKRWAAGIMLNRKKTHLGYFENEVEAAKAYDIKARELFGEFARPNFPTQIEQEIPAVFFLGE